MHDMYHFNDTCCVNGSNAHLRCQLSVAIRLVSRLTPGVCNPFLLNIVHCAVTHRMHQPCKRHLYTTYLHYQMCYICNQMPSCFLSYPYSTSTLLPTPPPCSAPKNELFVGSKACRTGRAALCIIHCSACGNHDAIVSRCFVADCKCMWECETACTVSYSAFMLSL